MSSGGWPPENLEVVADGASTGADPAAQAVTREEEVLLWRALSGLPENYREPMVLFYREQHSVAEVATGLDLSEDAVKQRLSRGRSMLREEMAKLVESALTRSRPTAAFTVGVLAALPFVSARTASAASTTGIIAGKGVAAPQKVFWPLRSGRFSALSLGCLLAFSVQKRRR